MLLFKCTYEYHIFFLKFRYLQVLRLFVVSFYLRVDSLRFFFLIKLYEKEPRFKEVRLSLQTLFFLHQKHIL